MPANFRRRFELRLGKPFNLLRETRPMHREKPHKLLQVGVTPTPATTTGVGPPREVIRLPDCKSGVRKQSRKRRTGALPAFPTNLRQGFGLANHIGLVAQSAERPVVCGRVLRTATRVQLPSGPPFFLERSSVFRALVAVRSTLGPGGRR